VAVLVACVAVLVACVAVWEACVVAWEECVVAWEAFVHTEAILVGCDSALRALAVVREVSAAIDPGAQTSAEVGSRAAVLPAIAGQVLVAQGWGKLVQGRWADSMRIGPPLAGLAPDAFPVAGRAALAETVAASGPSVNADRALWG
jgi:hypothetical protein